MQILWRVMKNGKTHCVAFLLTFGNSFWIPKSSSSLQPSDPRMRMKISLASHLQAFV
jgi:hypothetical protein